jgi:hypothetical protein
MDGAGGIHVVGSTYDTWQGDGGASALHLHGGWGQDDLMVLKLSGDASIVIGPMGGGTLVYTDPQGLTTMFKVPPGAVVTCIELAYTPLMSPTETLYPGVKYAHHAFLLHAYLCDDLDYVYLPLIVRGWSSAAPGPVGLGLSPGRNYKGHEGVAGMSGDTTRALPVPGMSLSSLAPPPVLLPGDPVFLEPVTITLHYSDADVAGINESTLHLVYWTGSMWAEMGNTCLTSTPYVRDPANNVIGVAICHMSQGALVGN